jgi:dTDP-4-dehydrorhamnose 3,5-epimerase-like enzyme
MNNEPVFLDIKTSSDNRGMLSSIEESIDIPMEIKRIFYMHHINAPRGGHAHIDTDQFIIALSGSFKINLFNGDKHFEYTLNDCTKGLFVPRLIFTELYDFSANCVCVVLANTIYDMKKSLRTLEDYVNYI